jgi:hypothetical protein
MPAASARSLSPASRSALRLSVAARFDAERSAVGEHHELMLRAFARNDVEPFFSSPPIGFDIAIPAGSHPDEDEIHIIVAMSLGAIPVHAPGKYLFELLLDGEAIAVHASSLRRARGKRRGRPPLRRGRAGP